MQGRDQSSLLLRRRTCGFDNGHRGVAVASHGVGFDFGGVLGWM